MPRTKIYFASDLHLGTPDYASSREREARFVAWLHEIEADAAELYLVGDLFDFWHEYETVVPRGFVRLLGTLGMMADSGIRLHIFTGNHDLWQRDYLAQELGATIYTEPISRTIGGKHFLIGHGDGLGPGDRGYKFIKRVFTNPLCRWVFRWLHPDLGTRLAMYLSRRSRYGNGSHELETYLGDDKEWLVQYCREQLSHTHYDYMIFGHRHLPIDKMIQPGSRYINLGDWIDYCSYAVYDGTDVELRYYKG